MSLQQHRPHERIVTAAVGAMCGLGFAGAISPIVEHAVTVAVLGLVGLGVLVLAGRPMAQRVRERREDHADTRAAIAWRAEHLPADHPLVVRDRRDRDELHHGELDRATRLGVA